jgi:hypothetical protein
MEREYNEAENGHVPPWNNAVFGSVHIVRFGSNNPIKLLVDISNILLLSDDGGTLHEE